jgi:general nucleoside transport system ATP-binding protein
VSKPLQFSAKDRAVEFKSVSKSYGAIHANREVTFSVDAGTIHAIVGENGAGKSTAMNLLYGMTPPTSGELFVFGKRAQFSNSQDAIHSGIGMVHQHFMLSRPQSVLDNIILGAEPGNFLLPIRRDEARREIQVLCEKVQFSLDLDAPVESLTVGAEQRVEILKALYRKVKVLILDEPTAVLTPQEVTQLFVNLKQMKADGMTIIIITHKLKEVLDIADAITVFRRGKVTGTFLKEAVSIEKLAEEMVGRKVVLPRNEAPAEETEKVLEIKKFFSIHRGEILGIAGVEGNGQSELIQKLMGITDGKAESIPGEVVFEGKPISHWSVQERIEAGISCIPEDRHHQAVALDFSVIENFVLGQEKTFSTGGFIQWGKCEERLKEWIREFEIRPPNPHLPMRAFSGGNQQKWVVARELERKPKLLIAAQPTRGVDIGAIEKIHGRLLNEKAKGTAILLISSELDEVLQLSDRILVLYRGKIVGEHRKGEVNDLRLGAQMGGKIEGAAP